MQVVILSMVLPCQFTLTFGYQLDNSQKKDESQRDYWERNEIEHRRSPHHPVVAEYVRSKLAEIKLLNSVGQDTSILDVGCGNGFFTYQLDQLADVTGVDYSNKMLSINPVAKKYQMNAAELDFEDNSFDIVFCHGLLHHVDDIDAVLSEMRRVTRKYIVIIEPNRNCPLVLLFSLIVKEERKALAFSLRHLRNMVKRQKLNIIEAYSHGILVPNKTPELLLPLVKAFNSRNRFGVTNTLICEKTE